MLLLKMDKEKIKYKDILSPEEYRVTQEGGTEAPYTGKYCGLFEIGTYLCVCCGAPLFSSETKFESESGWPDFLETIAEGVVKFKEDFSSGLKQIEVKCNNCNAHLGHIFDDGPPPNFKRY